MAEDLNRGLPAADSEVIARCRQALAAGGSPATAAAIARRLGRHEVNVRKVFSGERPLRPEFVRDLGQLAGVPVAELFHTLGWLPEREIGGSAIAELADGMREALRTLEGAQPYLAGLARPLPWAPLAAAELLMGDLAAAERFEVRLAQIVSGLRYRGITAALAEFSPLPGFGPLPEEQLSRMADAAGVDWRPGDDGCDGDFGLVRLELMVRTHRGLNDGQEFTWQGGPGHRTWRGAARTWPGHLLVQDVIGGRQLPAGEDPWEGEDPRTIVMVGGRHGTGPAAALLAEALGRQYVLVRPNLAVTGTGHVRAVPADAVRTRGRSWLAVAEHIAACHAAGSPWKAVVLVRPTAFEAAGRAGEIDPTALRVLVESPARVVYARPPTAYLRWWTARTAGDLPPDSYDPHGAVARLRRLYAEVEHGLGDRIAGRDLLLQLPAPTGELPALAPEIPGEVFDQTVRVAWTAFTWLSGTGLPRPGRLRGWQADLRTDPLAVLPRLMTMD